MIFSHVLTNFNKYNKFSEKFAKIRIFYYPFNKLLQFVLKENRESLG